jgi:hypothetical protein
MAKLSPQPRPGQAPITFDGHGRNAYDFSDLFDGQTAEVAQLDDLALPRIEALQTPQRFVEGNQVYLRRRREMIGVVKRDALGLAATLGGPARFGVIYQDLAHQTRGGAEEIGAVLPIDLTLVYQSQKSLVNKSRRLERVAGPLTAQVAARQTAQLVVDERRQLIAGALISLIPGDQQSSDFIRRRSHLYSHGKNADFTPIANKVDIFQFP